MRSTERKFVHIAAGCVLNKKGEVLICQRPARKLYPGEWEFPGGKVEAGESAEQALRRELREELGIVVTACRPLIRLRHVYPELSVDLDAWRVSGFDGAVSSTEHPEIAWVAPHDLPRWKLLAADRPIVSALRLPAYYIFTPPQAEPAWLRERVGRLPAGALLRLRMPQLRDDAYERMAAELLPSCRRQGLTLVLDRGADMVERVGAGGLHATAAVLRQTSRRPVPESGWFGASVHDAAGLRRVIETGADFAVLGAVSPTATHPDSPGMGWHRFGQLATEAGLPVYAIGGLALADAARAQASGAQGIAGISAFWD